MTRFVAWVWLRIALWRRHVNGARYVKRTGIEGAHWSQLVQNKYGKRLWHWIKIQSELDGVGWVEDEPTSTNQGRRRR